MATIEEQIAARKAQLAAQGGDIDAKIAARRAQLAQEANPSPDQAGSAMRARVDAALSNPPSPQSLEQAAQADQIAQDRMTLGDAGAAGAGSVKALQGLPFVGQWTDEAAGLIGGPGAAEKVRAVQGAMDRQYPGTSTALQIGGGVVGAVPLAAGAGAALAGRAATALPMSAIGKAVAGGAAGVALGAAEGASSGAGMAQDGQRGQGALAGAGAGAAVGGALGAAAPLASKAIGSIFEYMRGKDYGIIARTLGINRMAAKIVKDSLDAGDITKAEEALKRAGGDAVLADTGPAAAQALDSAVAMGGKATAIGRGFVESRAAAANDRLTAALDKALGPVASGIKGATREIGQRTATLRQRAYDMAYGQPIDYAADTGRAIESVIARIPNRQFSAAVQDANEAMQAAGLTNKQIKIEIGQDGSVKFGQMPNVMQLDYLKRGLDAVARSETDAVTGKISDAGRRAASLAADLRSAIADAVPGYKTAVKLGGDKIAEEQALAMGQRIFNATREDVATAMAGASREARQAAKRGVRMAVDDLMAKARATLENITDEGAAIQEVQKALTSLSSRDTRDKLRAVMGENLVKELYPKLQEAAAFIELRRAVAKGSATAIRTAGREGYQAAVESAPLSQMAGANGPVEAVWSLVKMGSGTTKAANIDKQQALAAQVARALTEKRGPEAEAALKMIASAMKGQPLKEDQARFIARALVGTAAVGAYQTAVPALAKQLGAQ